MSVKFLAQENYESLWWGLELMLDRQLLITSQTLLTI